MEGERWRVMRGGGKGKGGGGGEGRGGGDGRRLGGWVAE